MNLSLNNYCGAPRTKLSNRDGDNVVLHQVSTATSYSNSTGEPETQTLRSLAYRSLAASTPSDAQLHDLLQIARQRNKVEGLSGVLLFDHGAFFQWLEGPRDALGRVWNSISRDSRHCQVTLLRDEPTKERIFNGWDLHIARAEDVRIEAAVAALHSSSTHLLKRLVATPAPLLDSSWEELFATSVIPRILAAHKALRQSTDNIWHAEPNSGIEFARVLLDASEDETTRHVDAMLQQGAGIDALYQEVFEPAQVQLGKQWEAGRCNDFLLSIGLARLHGQIRRVNAALPSHHTSRPGKSVLLSAQPGEAHGVGLVMSSEVFDRCGWDVTCAVPNADEDLFELVQARWFDVLKLSQSGALRRDSHLASMRDTIDAARVASLNPALIIVVDGRTFSENPQSYRAVHADAAASCVLDAVPVAERLLHASRSVSANVQVSVS